MSNQLPEEKLNKLLPALSLLAKRIGAGVTPAQHALKEILLSIGVQEEGWALQELELWSRKLQQARTVSNDDEKTVIAAELQNRGIPSAPAILAVDAALPPPLIVEPQNINFGCLKPGEGANATLRVSGGSVKVIVRNNRFKVILLDLGSGNSLVKVQLLAGSAGESLQDNVLLQGERGELKVLVTAQWEKEPPLLQYCPQCKRKSLFWNRYDKKFECLNLDCKAEGPSLDKLAKPQGRHKLY
jgi:hypothetical protein